jgi:hypothetical protein
MSEKPSNDQVHTPGPWRWIEAKGSTNAKLVGVEYDGKSGTGRNAWELRGEVCDFGDSTQYYPTEGNEPSDADMRLIAAAPELLEACKAALLIDESDSASVDPREIFDGIRAAIARATT